MKVPLYILGFLARYGPQHGYLLKQSLEHVSDFASIKLPTVYYHLDKMAQKGFISASQEKDGKRPDKWVYTITESGRQALQGLLEQSLTAKYEGEFLLDAAFYFSDLLTPQDMLAALTQQQEALGHDLKELLAHKKELFTQHPEYANVYSQALFRHHEYHLRAEMDWLRETLDELHAPSPG